MRFLVPMLMLIVLTLPSTGAWVDRGSVEPDHPRDTPEVMWRDAGAETSRIVFNARPSTHTTSANPNVGILATRVLLPATQWEATLGLWRDCNGDGTIGSADGGLTEYPSALLDGSSICGGSSPHHVDGAVVELLAIGAVDPCRFEPETVRAESCDSISAFAVDATILHINGTFIWGDDERRDEGYHCPMVFPLARGTTSDTGKMFALLDCRLGARGAHAVNAVDSDGTLGLAFEDPEQPDDGASGLNQPTPVSLYGDSARPGWLARGTDEPAFTAWDCESQPAVERVDINDSHWDGVAGLADCVPGARAALDGAYVTPEADVIIDRFPRDTHDFTFRFAMAPHSPASAIAAAHDATGSAVWSARATGAANNAVLDRSELALARPQTFVFYARLGSEAAPFFEALPAGGATFAYGAEHCGTLWTGLWNCDPTEWWAWPAKPPTHARGESLAQTVGAPYHLRDVDCYDAGAGAWATGTWLDGARCPTRP